MPNEFVQLQSQTYRQAVRQDPFGKHPRIKSAPGSIWVGKNGREQYLPDTPG
jgi:hypothetical protein